MLLGLIFVVSALAGTAVWFLVGPSASGSAGRGVPASIECGERGGGGADAADGREAERRGCFEVFDAEALRRASDLGEDEAPGSPPRVERQEVCLTGSSATCESSRSLRP